MKKINIDSKFFCASSKNKTKIINIKIPEWQRERRDAVRWSLSLPNAVRYHDSWPAP